MQSGSCYSIRKGRSASKPETLCSSALPSSASRSTLRATARSWWCPLPRPLPLACLRAAMPRTVASLPSWARSQSSAAGQSSAATASCPAATRTAWRWRATRATSTWSQLPRRWTPAGLACTSSTPSCAGRTTGTGWHTATWPTSSRTPRSPRGGRASSTSCTSPSASRWRRFAPSPLPFRPRPWARWSGRSTPVAPERVSLGARPPLSRKSRAQRRDRGLWPRVSAWRCCRSSWCTCSCCSRAFRCTPSLPSATFGLERSCSCLICSTQHGALLGWRAARQATAPQ
mmetsp:Transcript_25683/g.81757  ORF Transcript_25683/g.81757 Transcript_25683/m.81757 type:complete len:287 (-) Transcript_25683:323-1183(-)